MTGENEMKRRDFIGGTGAAIAAGFGTSYSRILAQSEGSTPATQAINKITLGHIGVGQRGTSVLKEFLEYGDVEVAAVCDVDSEHRGRAIDLVEKAKQKKPEGYSDFRKLLERKDLDAVVIATPDHWHALTTIMACDSGRDVYVEKPLSHNIIEGQKMVEAAKRNKRITQMGTQIHNHPSQNYARVAKTVQSGILGKIQKVRCWKCDETQDLGNPPDADAPSTLDYDFWLGPAPRRAYNPNRSHFNFRFFWDYAGGKFSDFGCHIMDVALWSMNVGTAKSAVAAGGRFVTTDNSETPDTLEVAFEYPNFTMAFDVRVGNALGYYGMGGIGCIFEGTEGTLVTNYETHKIFAGGGKEKEIEKPTLELPPRVAHSREFLGSIKSRKRASCDIEYGHSITRNIHLGNIAYRTGTKVVWNEEKQTIVGSPEAVALMGREYRKPWSL